MKNTVYLAIFADAWKLLSKYYADVSNDDELFEAILAEANAVSDRHQMQIADGIIRAVVLELQRLAMEGDNA